MTSVGVFDVRRLVEQTQHLATPPAPRAEHPLGLGLQESHSLFLGEGIPRLRLPKRDAGLVELRAIIGHDVLDLTSEERRAAWHLLLARPTLCVPLRAPSVSELLEAGFLVTDEVESRIRAVGIATVIRYQEPGGRASRDDDPAPPARIAAVGRLVVVTDDNPGVSIDAWADVHWVRSARAFSRELEALHRIATPSSRKAGNRRSAVLILGDELSDSIAEDPGDDMEGTLSEVAGVHGYNVRILRSPKRFRGNVVDVLRNTPPSLLVVAAPGDPSIEAACQAYRDAVATPSISHLGKIERQQLVDDFREALAAAIGINPALQLRPRSHLFEPEQATPDVLIIPGIWPVEQPGQHKILEGVGSYVENLRDGYWYTRDNAGHAGSVVKRYHRVGRKLKHVADLAIDGSVISKHKGSAGAIVSLDDMRGV